MRCRCLFLAAISSLVIPFSITADEPAGEMHFERGIISVVKKQKHQSILEEKVKETFNNPLGLKDRYKYSHDGLEKYRSWIEQCLSHSQNGNFCLVIDKAAHEMDVYQNQKKMATYPIELGLNPYDDKKRLGDNCTPEGIYKIRHALKNSAFYKALYLDYPNTRDIKEFNQLKKEGIIPQKARIGGNIEIHGSGAEKEEERFDWTMGCIALSNKNIDSLYQILGLGNHRTMPKKELEGIAKKMKTCIVKYGARTEY